MADCMYSTAPATKKNYQPDSYLKNQFHQKFGSKTVHLWGYGLLICEWGFQVDVFVFLANDNFQA